MKPILLAVEVAAPCDRVWSMVTDIAGAPTNIPAIKSVEFTGPAREGLGTRWRETRVMFGREVTEQLEITEWMPPREYVVTSQNHGCGNRCAVRVRPNGGGAQLEYEFRITAHSLFARILTGVMLPFMRGAIRKALAADLAAIKTRCESMP